MGYAWDAIRSNTLDFIIMGGAEAGICPGVVAAFCAARALSTRNHEPQKACRPFNKDRDGFVLGEGAGMDWVPLDKVFDLPLTPDKVLAAMQAR